VRLDHRFCEFGQEFCGSGIVIFVDDDRFLLIKLSLLMQDFMYTTDVLVAVSNVDESFVAPSALVWPLSCMLALVDSQVVGRPENL